MYCIYSKEPLQNKEREPRAKKGPRAPDGQSGQYALPSRLAADARACYCGAAFGATRCVVVAPGSCSSAPPPPPRRPRRGKRKPRRSLHPTPPLNRSDAPNLLATFAHQICSPPPPISSTSRPVRGAPAARSAGLGGSWIMVG
jgi:hypothetical protein